MEFTTALIFQRVQDAHVSFTCGHLGLVARLLQQQVTEVRCSQLEKGILFSQVKAVEVSPWTDQEMDQAGVLGDLLGNSEDGNISLSVTGESQYLHSKAHKHKAHMHVYAGDNGEFLFPVGPRACI